MATDQSAFLVISIETSMTTMWRAMNAIRHGLAVSRVYWYPDARFRDGRHFNLQIPRAELQNPLAARDAVCSILDTLGIHMI